MKIKLFILAVLLSVFSVVFVFQEASAQTDVKFIPESTDVNKIGGCDGAASNSPLCKDLKSTTNPLYGKDGILTRAATAFSIVVGAVSVFMMMLGGLRYINSGGDSTKTKTARETIIYASIGVIITAVSASVVRFILLRVG